MRWSPSSRPWAPRPRRRRPRMPERHHLIVGPVITEKSSAAFQARKEYAFRVQEQATKPQIRAAIEALFDVTVTDVRTLVVRAKRKSYGRYVGRRPAWKKAIVTLFEGHDRLLPRRAAPHVAAVALPLGPHHQRAHVGHGHVEQRLDGRADLRLGRLLLHTKRVFLPGLKRRRGLLGDDRPDDQMVPLRHPRPPPSRSRRPGPGARRPPHPPRGSRTRWRRRTASRAPSAGCGPTDRRCARAPRPPSPPAPSSPPRPAWPAAPPASWFSASRTRARPPRTTRPRAPGRGRVVRGGRARVR